MAGAAFATLLLTRTDLNAFSLTICTVACLNLMLLLINEIGQATGHLKYKQMLDPHLEDANYCQHLYLSRTATITLLKKSSPLPDGRCLFVEPVRKRSMATFMLLLLKMKSVQIFSVMMITFAGNAAIDSFGRYAFAMVLFMTLCGSILSSGLCLFISTKLIFVLASLVQTIVLITALIFYVGDNTTDMEIPLLIYYAALGLGYCVTDISILDTAALPRTELSLAFGYGMEMFVLALLQYSFGLEMRAEEVDTFVPHVASYLAATIVLLLLVAIVFPNTYGKSLLDIRDKLFGIVYMHEEDRLQMIQTVLPSSVYGSGGGGGNSSVATVSTAVNVLPMGRNVAPLNLNSPNPYAAQGLYRSQQPVAGGGSSGTVAFGMNNQYSSDFNAMSPGNIIPKAIFGGAVLGAFSLNF